MSQENQAEINAAVLATIEQARKDNATELDLSGQELTELPKEIGQLANLTELNLDHNQLTELPKEIGQLANLTEIFLNENQITSLPTELGQLAKLTRLSITENQITSLPTELGQLANLQVLDLSENELTSVPTELGQLSNLKVLSLDRSQLTSVPTELGQLSNLTELYLYQTKLNSLPAELGKLSTLEALFLYQNKLTSLPTELGKLTNLRVLDLSDNEFTSLPTELGQLASLTRLNLSQNQLTSLPAELGQLANLTELNLDHNQLTSVPTELGQLANLTRIDLHENEGLGISVEILGPTRQEVLSGATPANPKDILDYCFRIQADQAIQEAQPLNEAKLILVGFGAVGKTSIVNRLLRDEFNPDSKKTEGIQITPWPVTINQTEAITLNIWDFGGQEIMHSTHQFFLTERSLYLLVLNGRQGHEDTDAEYWLELIKSFGGNSPVIIVLNKVNEHPFDVNRGDLQQKFPFIQDFIKTDCGEDNPTGLDELKAAIKRETNQLENVRAPFPASWIGIKQRLTKMDNNYISFGEYRDICAQDGEDDIEAQDSLAVHLHSLGIALNYKDDPRLRDTHVLNPHWVTNGIYTLLNAHEITDANGELDIACLTQVLDTKAYPTERHSFLLELMRKFELCFRFQENENRYLIPDLLDKQQPDEATHFKPEECLNFYYDYPVLPEGLLPRFIVRTHVLSKQHLRWRTGVILGFEGNRALVKTDKQDRRITISINGPVSSRRRLLAVIRADFDRIHSNFKFTPKEVVPAPQHPNVLISYQELKALEEAGESSLKKYSEDAGLLTLSIQDLLNGVDFEGSRQHSNSRETDSSALKLFYSYSHKDEALRDQLETHLKILQRKKLIQPWHDRCIRGGEDWATEIDNNLKQADIILLLVSSDFIASDYCYELEMKQAMERHQQGEANVIPISIRPADWDGTPFQKLQGFPTDMKPVTQWSDRDAAWLNVETGIKEAIAAIKAKR